MNLDFLRFARHKHENRSDVARYFDACDQLDEARAMGLPLFNFYAEVERLKEKAQLALKEERSIDTLFQGIANSFTAN